MKHSLKYKLILTYTAVALVTILSVMLVIRLTSDKSLRNMLIDQQISSLSNVIVNYYQNYGTLEQFFRNYMINSMLDHRPFENFNEMRDNPQIEALRGVAGLVDANGLAIFPTDGYRIGQKVPENLLTRAERISVDGEVIAYIVEDRKAEFELNPVEQRYTDRINLAIAAAAAVGMITAFSLAFLLTENILKPIKILTNASAEMSQGELGKQVPVISKDEIGKLSESFNRMSLELAKSDQERRRLTADITHDLSTPLQIISGYIEMLEEGSIELSPDRLQTIKSEVENLRLLVGDLTLLTQAEAGVLEMQKSLVDANLLLEKVFKAYEPIAARQGTQLELERSEQPCWVFVDEGRMIQVLKNLLDNALHHTSAGRTIKLSSSISDKVELIVSDNGTGIEPEDLPFIFERFYQADKARTGSKGKMGLGLAICKALTAAQGCDIRAESSGKDQGTCMIISIDKIL